MATKDGRPENLRPVRSKEEAREKGRKGGIASGKSRRKKKAMKTMLNEMLAAKLPDEAAGKLEALGVDPEDANYQAAVGAALLKKAMNGNIHAIQLLANLTGDDPYVQARQSEVRTRREELKLKERQVAAEERALESKEQAEDFGAQVDEAFGYDAAREEYYDEPD